MFHFDISARFSGMTFAIFLSSLLYVFGHCISVHETGTNFVPGDSELYPMTTPSSFSAVVSRKPDPASPRLRTRARMTSVGRKDLYISTRSFSVALMRGKIGDFQQVYGVTQ